MATEQKLPPASYTGPSGGLKKATVWLASEDVGTDVELTVTIVDVELHRGVKFDAGRTEDKVPALRFKEIEKHMILNSTNRKFLVRMFGMDTKDWRNQRVAIFVDPDVKFAGQKVNGLRLRPAQPVPEGWETWTNEQRGENRANAGTQAFRAWWKTLTKEERESVKGKTAEWKTISDNANTAQPDQTSL